MNQDDVIMTKEYDDCGTVSSNNDEERPITDEEQLTNLVAVIGMRAGFSGVKATFSGTTRNITWMRSANTIELQFPTILKGCPAYVVNDLAKAVFGTFSGEPIQYSDMTRNYLNEKLGYNIKR